MIKKMVKMEIIYKNLMITFNWMAFAHRDRISCFDSLIMTSVPYLLTLWLSHNRRCQKHLQMMIRFREVCTEILPLDQLTHIACLSYFLFLSYYENKILCHTIFTSSSSQWQGFLLPTKTIRFCVHIIFTMYVYYIEMQLLIIGWYIPQLFVSMCAGFWPETSRRFEWLDILANGVRRALPFSKL